MKDRIQPKPDVVSAQGSLNLDARVRSVSAPNPEHPGGVTTTAPGRLQACDLEQHLCLGDATEIRARVAAGAEGVKTKQYSFPLRAGAKRLYFRQI